MQCTCQCLLSTAIHMWRPIQNEKCVRSSTEGLLFFWYCASERRANNVKTQSGMLAFFMIFSSILMSFSVPGIQLEPVGLP